MYTLSEWTEWCANAQVPAYEWVASIIICFILVIILTVITINSFRDVICHQKTKAKAKRPKSPSFHSHSHSSTKQSKASENNSLSAPLFMDSDNPLSRRTTGEWNRQLKQHKYSPKVLQILKIRTVLSIIVVISLFFVGWTKFAELSCCHYLEFKNGPEKNNHQVDKITNNFNFDSSICVYISEIEVYFFDTSLLELYLLFLLRLYLLLSFNESLYFLQYPNCLYIGLVTMLISSIIIAILINVLFVYDLTVGLLIFGIFELFYVIQSLLLLFLFLYKLKRINKNIIQVRGDEDGNVLNRVRNIMVKYTLLTFLTMLSGVIVSGIRVYRFIRHDTKSMFWYEMVSIAAIGDAIINLIVVYLHFSVVTEKYYKYCTYCDDCCRKCVEPRDDNKMMKRLLEDAHGYQEMDSFDE